MRILYPGRIGIWRTRRKTLGARTRTNNKLDPHMSPGRNWTRRHPCSPSNSENQFTRVKISARALNLNFMVASLFIHAKRELFSLKVTVPLLVWAFLNLFYSVFYPRNDRWRFEVTAYCLISVKCESSTIQQQNESKSSATLGENG